MCLAAWVRCDHSRLNDERVVGTCHVLHSIRGHQILIFYTDVLTLIRFLNHSSTHSVIIPLSSIYCLDSSLKGSVWVD